MDKPFIVRRGDGEYSTITLPNGVVETMWFGNDGSAVLVGRTYASLASIAENHINAYESEK